MFKENGRTKLLTLLAMCFALFMAMLDNTVVNVALPKIQADLGSGVSGLQWIIDAYALLFAALLLTGGTLGDVYGRKKVFLGGIVIFTLGSFLCGVAPSIGSLIAARALQGIGAAALMPGSLSILTVTFPDHKERAQAIGIWAGVSALALALGPVVGGVVVDSLGWQWVFFLNVPIGIAALFVVTRVVAESRNPGKRGLDLPGQVLAIAWLGALTYAFIEGNSKGWTSPLIVSMFVVAAVGLVAFLVVERRGETPMLELSFFRNPTFSAANAVAGLVSFGMFGIFFFLSLFFQDILRYSAVGAGLRFLPTTGAIILTAPLAGRLAGRIGSRIPMAVGMALVGSSLLLLLGVSADSSFGDFWWILPIQGVGMGLTMTPMTAAAMSSVPPARAGMASATQNASRQTGGVIGIAVLGAVLTARFTSTLTATLTAAGIPAGLRERIVAAGSNGGVGGGSTPGVTGSAGRFIERAVGTAFVDGMHVALLVAAVTLFAGVAVALAFVRPAAGTEAETKRAPVEEPAVAIA